MIRLLIACLAALLVSSCLDSHEEVWMNADASGKARVKISLPLSVVIANGGEKEIRSMILDYFESTPAFTSYTVETAPVGDQLEINVAMSFDDAFKLKDSSSSSAYKNFPDAAGDLLGTSEVEIQGSNLNFHRTIDLTQAIPGSMFIPKDQLKGHKLTTIIHLPKAALSHNAHAAEDSGKTLIWTTPLATAFRHPVNQMFTMEIPTPWLTIGLIALAVALLVGTVSYFVYRRKKSAT
ncbi:MAG: hypothetical protein V4727_01465 [Verrucomicrobiota bacterium]